MKRLLNVGLVGLITLGMSGCSSEDMSDVYSSRGAEQDKNMLELSTQELNDDIIKLGKTDFANICFSMSKRLEGKNLDGKEAFFASIINIGKLMNENEPADCYFDELTSIMFNEEGQCNAIKADGYGTWQWDKQTQAFVKTKAHDSEIAFKFPATDDLIGDTACLTITDLETSNANFLNKGQNLDSSQTLNKILTTLRLNIKVKDELILTTNISNKLDENGHFEVVGMTFNPKPFTFTGEMAREDQDGYWILAIRHDTRTIIEHNLSVSFDTSNETMPIRQLTNQLNINAISLTTEALTSDIYDKLKKVEALPEDSEEHAKALAKALQEHASLTARYTNDNTIIAKVDAVAKLDEQALKPGVWYVDLEFVFSDGSRQSGEQYYDDYLTTFKVELEQLVSDFEEKFGV